MPTSYPLYTSPSGTGLKDAALTAQCGGTTPAGLGCGDYAVNTIQPAVQPFSSPTALKLPPQTAPDDRRPPERQGHRLGLVLGWLVERQR